MNPPPAALTVEQLADEIEMLSSKAIVAKLNMLQGHFPQLAFGANDWALTELLFRNIPAITQALRDRQRLADTAAENFQRSTELLHALACIVEWHDSDRWEGRVPEDFWEMGRDAIARKEREPA